MPCSEALVLLVQVSVLLLAILVCDLERGVASDTRLLRELLVLLVKFRPLVLELGELGLRFIKLLSKLIKLLLIALILSLDELELLTSVREHDDVVDNLTTKAGELLVTLLDLLVKRLILDLELLVIDQVKTLSKLLLLLQHLLLVLETISQCNILKAVLMHLLVLGLISLFPLLDYLGLQLLVQAGVHSVHGDRALELLELLLDLCALGLLLVELVLKLTGHTVVAILSLLQVIAHLMDVSEGVEILVLVEHLISVLLLGTSGVVHNDNLLLALLILLLKLKVLAALVLDSLDQLALHGRVARKIAHAAIVVFLVLFALVAIIVG